MIRKTLTLAVMLCSFVLVSNAQDKPKMTLKRAESIIPRPALAPVPSLEPTTASPIDTLETTDPRVKLVLFSDNTWKHIKNESIMRSDSTFTQNWDTKAIDPFHVQLTSLPDRLLIWLVDDANQFCCPYQTKVYSKFGIRRGRRHQGSDLPLKTGEPVKAAFEGMVRISQSTKGYGNLVVIRHPNGLETFYGHLSRRDVQPGDWVNCGDVIGLGGSTGRSTGPHLHFETRYQGYAFDPEWLVDFENGILRSGVFSLKKSYLSANSKYVPQSEDEEEEILLIEGEEREIAAKKAAEEAAKQYHTIKSGDTLGSLAVKYHTTVKQICAWNNITTKTTLRIGRKLRVK